MSDEKKVSIFAPKPFLIEVKAPDAIKLPGCTPANPKAAADPRQQANLALKIKNAAKPPR